MIYAYSEIETDSLHDIFFLQKSESRNCIVLALTQFEADVSRTPLDAAVLLPIRIGNVPPSSTIWASYQQPPGIITQQP